MRWKLIKEMSSPLCPEFTGTSRTYLWLLKEGSLRRSWFRIRCSFGTGTWQQKQIYPYVNRHFPDRIAPLRAQQGWGRLCAELCPLRQTFRGSVLAQNLLISPHDNLPQLCRTAIPQVNTTNRTNTAPTLNPLT